MEENTILLKSQFDRLPKNLQDFISRKSWLKELEHFHETYGLNEDQAKSLEMEVMLVLFNFESIEDLEKNISQNTNIPEHKLFPIINDVHNLVLQDVEETLHNLSTEEDIAEGNDEKVGGVDIENEPKIPDNLPGAETDADVEKMFDKTKMIAEIESPQPSQVTTKERPQSVPLPDYSGNREAKSGYKDIDPYREPIN